MLFWLSKLLLLVVVIALSLATFGPWGIAVTAFLVAQCLWIRHASHRVSLVVALGLLFLLGSCMIHGHREASRLMACRNNARAIGLALLQYHQQYGMFPPQYVADAEGRPMHSWRVLILPYLQESDTLAVYEKYRFDEPWNGPHNRELATQVRWSFRCPSTDAAEPAFPQATHYVAVAGPGTAWPGPSGTRRDDIADGCGNTILLVEIAGSDIHWMEPRDATLEEVLACDNGPYAVPSSHHYWERMYFFLRTFPLAGCVLTTDGSCHCLETRPSREDLAALLSIDGGESVDSEMVFRWQHDTSGLQLDPFRCVSFALFFVFLLLAVGMSWRRRNTMSEGEPTESQ